MMVTKSLQKELQHLNLGNRGDPSERTYINVTPAAIASRQGGVILNPSASQLPRSTTPKVPLVPKSQDVKHAQEPSYSTVLQLQRENVQYRPTPLPPLPPLRPKQQVSLPSTTSHEPQQHFNDGAIYANCSMYSGMSNYSELEALRSSDSQGSTEEEIGGMPSYASPPSPVSSSYSELRQATRGANPPGGYLYQQPPPPPAYGMVNQHGASNYESLYDYEPIHPRTHSTARLDFNSLYRMPTGQKSDVYKSMSSSSSDSDYFGMCSKCQGKIIGEGTGCTAMGRIYHIACFTCFVCSCKLQGKPFYALDGKPCCQADYMNTMEKCCKCLQPIQERILRATGKPYHPQCFTCIVCGKSLDGIPFTVDATNQIHCIEDFHRRFAPKCSVCKHPIMPEQGQEETVRVVALDRSFHVKCYKCEDCGLLLSSEKEGRGCYPLDDHVLCKRCNTMRIQALTNGIE